MAVRTPGTVAQQATTTAAPQQQFQQTQSNQQPPRQPLTAPVFGLQSQMVGMGSGGETFEKLYSKIQTTVKRINEERSGAEKFGVIKLLKHVAGLNYSGIVVAGSFGGVTTAYVLMVEKTGAYPEKISDTYNGMRYEIVRTPGDALDMRYITAAQQAAATFMKSPLDDVIVVDGTLVPNEFDVENDGSVDELLDNAIKAIYSEIAIRANDYKGQDLQSLIQNYRSGKFIVNLQFNSEDMPHYDQTGMPIRQDICVSLSFKLGAAQNNRSVNQGDDSVEVVRTYGYIDFEHTGSQVFNGMASTQKFAPNFIITHVESPSSAPTPDVVMLGVASVLSLNENMNWLQAFKPTPARKDITDFNDVGGLNFEGNFEQSPTGYGKRYDTKGKQVTTAELFKLMQTLCQPNLMVSIDIPKAGPETWYTSLFHHIAEMRDQRAYARLVDFMTASTGGAYQNRGEAVFEGMYNKIHGGFYRTKDGFRDLRHVCCYLGVANHVIDTNQSPMVLSQYTNSLYNSQVPAELRAAARRVYIDSMTNNTAVYKQMYERRTFTAPFLTGYVTALRAIGFDPVYSSNASGNDMFVKRSTAMFQNAMIGADVRLMATANTMYNGWNQYGNYARAF